MAGDTPLPQKAMNSVTLTYAVCVENTTLVAPAIFQTRPLPVVLQRPRHGFWQRAQQPDTCCPMLAASAFKNAVHINCREELQSLHCPESLAGAQIHWHFSSWKFSDGKRFTCELQRSGSMFLTCNGNSCPMVSRNCRCDFQTRRKMSACRAQLPFPGSSRLE